MRRRITDPDVLMWDCLLYLCLATTLSTLVHWF